MVTNRIAVSVIILLFMVTIANAWWHGAPVVHQAILSQSGSTILVSPGVKLLAN